MLCQNQSHYDWSFMDQTRAGWVLWDDDCLLTGQLANRKTIQKQRGAERRDVNCIYITFLVCSHL